MPVRKLYPYREVLLVASLVWYVFGLLIQYLWGQYNTDWQVWIFLWNKVKDLLLLGVIYYFVPAKYQRPVFWVLMFALIRVICEILSIFKVINVNNLQTVRTLFIALSLVCGFLVLNGVSKWHKSNGQ